jgi:3-hydroxybutyryl-CoA dehydratase
MRCCARRGMKIYDNRYNARGLRCTMIGKTYDQLSIGETAKFSKTISESDIYLYAGITGDFNPAHINETYAWKTHFKTRIAHGMLAAGLISAVIGTRLPGPGTIYVNQTLNFLAPVQIGDTITAAVEIIEKLDKKKVRLKTVCINQDGKIVLDGEALVSPPRLPKK